MSKVKKAMITAVCVALCVVLAMAFRAFPGGGAVYGPLMLPVLVCALACGVRCGVLCALLALPLSAVINASPTVALFLPVLVECLCCAVTAGLIASHAPQFDEKKVYPATLLGLLVARIAGGVVEAALFAPGLPAFGVYAAAYIVSGVPGLVVMLVLVPRLVRALAAVSYSPSCDIPAKEQTNGE